MNKIIVILIIIALVLSIVIVALNFFYQPDMAGIQTGSQQSAPPALKDLHLNMIAMSANGKISKINGNKITISNQQESMAIIFKDNAIVSAVQVSGAKKTANQGPLSLKDLKIGDSVYANFKLLPNNTIQGISVIVMPPSSK